MKIKKIILRTFLILMMLFISFGALVIVTMPKGEKLPELQNGDIIFQTAKDPQSGLIMLATHSFLTNVGIIRLSRSGQPIVIAVGDSITQVPLDTWIRQGQWRRIKILRPYNFTSDQVEDIITSAEPYFGRLKDTYFSSDAGQLYSSEMVYHIFNAQDIALGQVQKMGELSIDNPLIKYLVRFHVANHPACAQAATPEICWQILLQESVVTPASLAHDSRLGVVYSNYFPPKVR